MKTTSQTSSRLTAVRLAAVSAMATGVTACAGVPTSPFEAPHGLVRVSIESGAPSINGRDPSIALQRLADGQRTLVCRAPCGDLVDARNKDEYVLTYNDDRFRAAVPLHDERGEVKLTLDRLPSSTKLAAGITGMVLGSLAISVGATLMVFSMEGPAVSNFRPALVTFLSGVVLLPTGGGLFAFGRGSYSMTVTPEVSPVAPPLPGAPRDAPQAGFVGGLRGAF